MRNTNMQKGMTEATRLTRAGRLGEATALIQRALGNWSAGDAPTNASWDSPGSSGTTSSAIPASPTRPASPPTSLPGGSISGPLLSPVNRRGAARTPGLRRRPEATIGTPALAGRFVSGSYANGAGTRSYKLYIPSGTGNHTGQPMPLVVMLHGCTQNPDDFAAGTNMNALAESGGFFVVYPEQSGSANMQRCWNWFQPGDQQRDRGEPSIIAGITRQILTTQPVDPRRIYVAGMSAGGAMAAVMAATYPDLYAAAGVHSGLAHGAAHDLPSAFQAMKQGAPDAAPGKTRSPGSDRAADLARVVPTIVFHGDRDTTVHRRNGEQVLHQWTGASEASAAGRATVRTGQVPGGHSYTLSVYRDTGDRPVAERWIVHGAGHAWSGGSPRGSYTDSQGPDASAEMLRFFLEHPLRESMDPAD